MRRFFRRTHLLTAVLLSLAGTVTVPAQSSPPVLETSLTGAGRYAFSRLSALAVSSVSDRFAVADENLNRVFVFQSDGRLAFVIGEPGWLAAPVAVCFESDATLLIVTRSLLVLRANESMPDLCDTVADLSVSAANRLKRVSNLTIDKQGYIVLDQESGQVGLLDSAWSYKKVLIGHGHGSRGKVWEPTDLELDLSGRLIVSDRGDYPVQVFTSSGSPLFAVDWSTPDRQRSWEAAAVAVTRQEMIWAADVTNRRWRVYDQTGTQVDEFEFQPAGLMPMAASVTVDNRLIVMDERGTVSIWSILR